MTAAAITVVCPHCKGRMQASSEHIGRKGRCTFCKMLVEIKPSPDESLAMIQPTGTVGIAREADARLSSTNVPAWQAGLLGAAATAVLYLAVFVPLRATEFGKKFLDRGPMQYATTLVTCWGLALLALKHRAVRRQRSYAEQELEFFPLDIALQISPRNVDQFLAHVANQPKPRRLSILGRRIQGALEHFKSRHSVPEVQQYLATQAELDASSVDSGYTLLRSFVWVIPLFGFIGTVQGIGDAVSGLDRSLKSGAGQEQLLAVDAAHHNHLRHLAVGPGHRAPSCAAQEFGKRSLADAWAATTDLPRVCQVDVALAITEKHAGAASVDTLDRRVDLADDGQVCFDGRILGAVHAPVPPLVIGIDCSPETVARVPVDGVRAAASLVADVPHQRLRALLQPPRHHVERTGDVLPPGQGYERHPPTSWPRSYTLPSSAKTHTAP